MTEYANPKSNPKLNINCDFRLPQKKYVAQYLEKLGKGISKFKNHLLRLKTTDSATQNRVQAKTNTSRSTPYSAKSANQHRAQQGCVYLIGAGAGDPELLTMKAYRLIQTADVILVDWLVDPAMYPIFPKTAEVKFVGKKCGKHSVPQQDICNLLVDEAQQGKVVVRLKGGDPSIFARLAEETDILQAHHIRFAIVPGVTAASMCAAYSGIPLTHRDCAQSVQLVTAHRKREDLQPNWAQLAQSDSTLVFYMGLNRIASIAQNLMLHGKAATLPIAIIDQGGAIAPGSYLAEHQDEPKAKLKAKQTVIVSNLRDIQTAALQQKIADQCQGPALIIVGDVVAYRQQVDLAMLATESATNGRVKHVG